MRIGMGWGGALVGCGSCSSRGVTATVQMRSPGSVRFISTPGCSTNRCEIGGEMYVEKLGGVLHFKIN